MQNSRFHSRRGTRSPVDDTKKLAILVKNTLLVLLLVALVVSLVLGIPAMRYRSGAKANFVERMVVECGDAQYYLGKLSNTGGSSTYAQLAKSESFSGCTLRVYTGF